MNSNLERLYAWLEEKSNFLLFDLEANYIWEGENKDFETIQIGYLKYNSNFEIITQGSIFVRPKNAYILNDFILHLTWITQKQVDHWKTFPLALREFMQHFDPHKDYIVSYGNYDMKQLYKDCSTHNIMFPFDQNNTWRNERHINIKNALAKKLDIREKGMGRLLEYLWLELIWKHHNGEDDCVNIFNCIRKVFGAIK